MADVTMTRAQYEQLVSAAKLGAVNASAMAVAVVKDLCATIDDANDIHRHFLMVQWQESDKPDPATDRFPHHWPPQQRQVIYMEDRSITRSDVHTLLSAVARKPVNVLVTVDPLGVCGWTQLDTYFAR